MLQHQFDQLGGRHRFPYRAEKRQRFGRITLQHLHRRIDDPEAEKGYRIVGDVDYDAVAEVAGAITPVPGGVGVMTIAMLMQNTLASARGDYS